MAAISVLIVIIVWLAVMALYRPTRADEDPRKEWVRFRYTEFCAVVKPPPQELVASVDHTSETDRAAVGIARCGDA